MKKLIFTFLILFASVNMYAQHLKFMGIPLDGTISNFQQKLSAKGISPNRELNRTTPTGVRTFYGPLSAKLERTG